MFTHSGVVEADADEASRASQDAPGAGDLLLNLDHPEVSLPEVVVEGDTEVDQETLTLPSTVP